MKFFREPAGTTELMESFHRWIPLEVCSEGRSNPKVVVRASGKEMEQNKAIHLRFLVIRDRWRAEEQYLSLQTCVLASEYWLHSDIFRNTGKEEEIVHRKDAFSPLFKNSQK